MRKRVLRILVVTSAVNFFLLGVGAAWLVKRAKVDRQKMTAIKQILFPPPAAPVSATQPTTAPAATQPIVQLEELLARIAGRPPVEQLEYIRRSFQSQKAELERAQRDLLDMQSQVRLARNKLEEDRRVLEEEKKQQAARDKVKQATRVVSDKGFQDTLALYESMPAKQVKAIFMGLDDATVLKYLQAMESRTVSKIAKEFKTPQDTARFTKLMELMRQAQPSTGE